MEEVNIKYLDIEELKPYEKNPRLNDGAVEQVKNSIKEFGFKVPIVIDKNNCIIAGHTRVKAAKELNIKEIPTIKADDLTEEQAKAFRIVDNKVSELAEWNFDLLESELFELEEINFDMDRFGFDSNINISDTEIIDDNELHTNVETIFNKGDVYKLGNHKLMCGDSTNINDLKKLIGNKSIDLVLTDPPYGISVVNNNKIGNGGETKFNGTVRGGSIVNVNKYMPIKGDESTETAKDFIEICREMEIPNYIIFGGNYFTDILQPSPCWIVWDKENTGNFADVEMAWTSFNKGAKLYRWLWNGLSRKGERKAELKSRIHPTQKPVGLMAEILKEFTVENENILDGFGGSGSTLIACEQLNRNCYIIEYEKYYCDVIKKRWEDFTGLKAEKIS